MQGQERLWALCHELRIPRAAVKSVQWREKLALPVTEVGWRFGTAFPGVLVAGWFYGGSKGKGFLYLPRATYFFTLHARQVIALELVGYHRCNWTYLACFDDSLANRIKTWSRG
ncbi:MAG: hypothetical protein WBP03_02405 [Candidatus Saccharimonadales bacterium]